MSYNFIENSDPIVGDKKESRRYNANVANYPNYSYSRSYVNTSGPVTEPVKDPLGNSIYPISDPKTDNLANAMKCGLTSDLSIQQVKKLEDYSIDVALSTAKTQQLASTYRGLIVRDIIPSLDFIDGNGNAIARYDWCEPVSGGYTTSSNTQTIFKTSQDVKNQFKVFVFWGVRNVNSGPARVSGVLDSAAIIWSNPNGTAVYDIWQTEGLDTHNELYSKFPLVYGNKDPLKVDFWIKSTASGQIDNIQLLGKCVEPLGQTIQGPVGLAKNYLQVEGHEKQWEQG